MAQFAADGFTGSPGDELSAYNAAWIQHSSSTVEARLTNANRVRGSGAASGAAVYYHTGNPGSADYSVSADVYEASDASYGAGVIARCSTSANTFYMARWYTVGSDVVQLFKFVAGAVTQLGSDYSDELVTGTSGQIKLECIGSAIKVYVRGNPTSVISVTDTSITAAGKAGIRLGYGGAAVPIDTLCLHLTNFSADDMGGGGGGIVIPVFVNHYHTQGIM